MAIVTLLMKLFGDSVHELVTEKIDQTKATIEETLKDLKVSIEGTLTRIAKKMMMLALMLFGLILGLIGLAHFITSHYPFMRDGIGLIIVGLLVIIISAAGVYFSSK